MRSGFTKGIMVGSLIGASVGMIMNSDMIISSRTKKRMMKSGRNFLRKSGNIVHDAIDLFR